MDIKTEISVCPLCGTAASPDELAEASWLPPAAVAMLENSRPGWHLLHGACPRCVKEVLMRTLVAQADSSQYEKMLAAGPLSAEAVFGILPTPMRLHADPRYTGRGVTMALVDSGFYPHPDLALPRNRIRAWVDATVEPVRCMVFGPDDAPQWPGWDSAQPSQWHGLMTSAVAAGNGLQSRGLYRGLACEADLLLVQVRGSDGNIGNRNICRALEWLRDHGPEMGVRLVSLSVAGSPGGSLTGNPVDTAVAALVRSGITVVTAAGNDGKRYLAPPATAPEALTIGGLDDKNNFDFAEVEIWHSNYGSSTNGLTKPELVAPSIWVVAPILPGSDVAEEAASLFAARHLHNLEVERRIAELKLVTPHYQHVEGTSFAAPLVASVIACMLEANPTLTPQAIRDILVRTAQPVDGFERARQGAGALVPARALAEAMREKHGPLEGFPVSPRTDPSGTTFILHDRDAQDVRVWGSWELDGSPTVAAKRVRAGVWRASLRPLEPGRYKYRFLLDGLRWMDDPENPLKEPNLFGGFDSILEIPHVAANDGPAFAQAGGEHADSLSYAWS